MQVNRAIIIADKDVTGFARNAIEALSNNYTFETFQTMELVVDIMKHELIPRHVLLTDEEKKTLLKRYNLKDSQLPRMKEDDPVARYFGLSRGQVLKITRASETAGRYVTYRIVY